ncbi:hypothetical protein [Priestia taiwanensis]|uniref:DUF4426 domain-containing protein n=1 Tax=Priestia taiwanensis TaxID=1347902 RepID=A0A917AKX5_9BACI|nr:hypothetical protein [Priestia taiwanensis]MBM7361975.1 hypothetical protein [Priestia taiwanensis]GGE58456.1 hypothetical protein GCM10007140_06010 [Priestia taiwanensis]
MFKQIILSSVLLTGTLGTSTALAQTNNLITPPAYKETEFQYGPIDFHFSSTTHTHTIDQLLHVTKSKFKIDTFTAVAIYSDKPFRYTVVLKNLLTNEFQRNVIKGKFNGIEYAGFVEFGPLETATYQVILGNMAETEQKGQIRMWSFQG